MKKLNKKDLIKRMVVEPATQKRMFWAREMKMLNDLMELLPNEDFWKKVNIDKVPSLAIIRSGEGLKKMKKKFIEFNYKIPTKIEIPIGKKTGEDKYFPKNNKTVRQFIDE